LYIITAEGDSYTYSGDCVATFTPSGQSAVYFTHDSRGRMTYDGVGGVTIDYNYLNLPRKISGTGGTLAKYSYLANGSKTEAEDGSGAGLVYRGSLIYKKASNGNLTFDGVKSSASTSPARKTRPRTSAPLTPTSAQGSTALLSAAGWSPTP
jgi:hypothetical protein